MRCDCVLFHFLFFFSLLILALQLLIFKELYLLFTRSTDCRFIHSTALWPFASEIYLCAAREKVSSTICNEGFLLTLISCNFCKSVCSINCRLMQKLPIETGVYSIEYAYCDQLNSCKS